jgi:hypothetical protein
VSAVRGRWEKLHDEVAREREASAHTAAEITTSIVRRLRVLGSQGHSAQQAIGWLWSRPSDGRTRIDFKPIADGRNAWGHPAVRLRGLEHVEDGAVLTLSIDVDRRKSTILSYSVSIEGNARTRPGEPASTVATPTGAGRPWYARVDLTDAPVGQGLCGHALLHCHVGGDPGPNEKFSARVPLPWLHPADALDWLLATVDRSLEPRFG